MAESTISGMVLDRRANAFKDDKTGEMVEYFDALIFDPEADPTLTVYRSMDKNDLEVLKPGTKVTDVPCRVEKRHTVPVTLVKSPRAGGQGVRF